MTKKALKPCFLFSRQVPSGSAGILKRLLCLALVLSVLFLAGAAAEGAGVEYRTLRTGDKGEDVIALKTAMYYLGYYKSLDVSGDYNDLMAKRIRQLQKANGLPQDGVASPELQALIYSGQCVPAADAPAPTAVPTAAPEPSATPVPSATPGSSAPSATPDAVPSPSEAPVQSSIPADAQASAVPDPTVSPYRTLSVGDSGSDVLRLKQAMYYLGYFTSLGSLTDSYNRVMSERVANLQRNNGLTADGIASPELQALIYSGLCRPTEGAPAPTQAPTPTPVPLQPGSMPADIPPVNEKGFLLNDETYLYENAKDGLWLYKTNDLSITVARYEDRASQLIWFETEVWCSPSNPLTTYLSQGSNPGKRYASPLSLAEESGAVLAVTDDFFGFRWNYNYRTGIVIRNGKIIGERTYAADRSAFPNLEVLAVFRDGSMKCFLSDAMTAQEYLEAGAVQTFAFGPILVTDGRLGPHMTSTTYYHYREPRCAIGMIEPWHYVIVTVKGRADDSRGIYLNWLAERMLYLVCRGALNLDGGGTVSLIFNGKMLNKTTKNLRSVTSIICFGQRD